MKQKFVLLHDKEKDVLVIREYAELDKEILSLLCEETYDRQSLQEALKEGKPALLGSLRTKNMYPPSIFAEKIADAVVEIFATNQENTVELTFDDAELLYYEDSELKEISDLDDDSDDIDDLIDDEFEDSFEDKEKENIKKIKSPLKIADDEPMDIDDDS